VLVPTRIVTGHPVASQRVSRAEAQRRPHGNDRQPEGEGAPTLTNGREAKEQPHVIGESRTLAYLTADVAGV
jgi:hypothetical protein